MNRRTLLQVAVATAAARGKPGHVYASEVQPEHILTSPVAFANDVRGDLGDDFYSHLMDFIAPEEYAEYQQAKVALMRFLEPDGVAPFGHPFHALDEASLAWGFRCYGNGIEHGAAFEHLRTGLTGPTRSCHRCDARGLVNADGRWWHRGAAFVCPDCNGLGTVTVR